MTRPAIDPAIAVHEEATLATSEGTKHVVHGALEGAEVTAIALGGARVREEAEARARLADHPAAPREGRALGDWWVVPRARLGPIVPSPEQANLADERVEGAIAELLARSAPAPDRGGNVDVLRALRHLELPRGPLERWLASRAAVSFVRGPDLGGLDPGLLAVDDASERVVALSLRRARIDGFPELDRAAEELFGTRERAAHGDEVIELARDLARVHVAVRELARARPGPLRERARAWVTDRVLARLVRQGPRARREPFRDPEPQRVRRQRLFSRFFEGIRYDDEGLYSATPEALALRIAKGLAGRVLDATCGIGAIAIALARTPDVDEVIAIDLVRERLDMARHNARIYGVEGRIRFVHGDVRELLPRARFDAVVIDPPWGGRDYDRRRVGLAELGLALPPLIEAHRGPLRIKLPRSFAREELPGFAFEELADERGVVKLLLASRP